MARKCPDIKLKQLTMHTAHIQNQVKTPNDYIMVSSKAQTHILLLHFFVADGARFLMLNLDSQFVEKRSEIMIKERDNKNPLQDDI